MGQSSSCVPETCSPCQQCSNRDSLREAAAAGHKTFPGRELKEDVRNSPKEETKAIQETKGAYNYLINFGHLEQTQKQNQCPPTVAENPWHEELQKPQEQNISLSDELEAYPAGIRHSQLAAGGIQQIAIGNSILGPADPPTKTVGQRRVKPLIWERFLGADLPSQVPCCGCASTVIVVMLLVFIGFRMMKMSDVFGFFVLSDKLTQAYFAHHEFLKDRQYFTDVDVAGQGAVHDRWIPKRSVFAALATVFLEVKGTKCPGEDCDLRSKNLITAKYLGYMKKVEERIWNDPTFQAKYCALLKPAGTKCRPPRSPLSLMLWGNGVAPTAASKALADEGYWSHPGLDHASCQTWHSPLETGDCFSPAWTHVSADSGAAAPADLQSYSTIIDKMCTKSNNYWESLQEAWLPSFACTSNHMRNDGVPFLRSQLLFGLPYDRDRKISELDYGEQLEDLAAVYGKDFFKLCSKIIKDVLDGDDDVNIVVNSPVSMAAERQAMQQRTLRLTAASFLFVFLYMWFNVESCFLACFGMLQVLFSLFPTVLVWHVINRQGVQFLQFLAVFMILGIGADDVFVLNDAWKQVKYELASAGDVAHVQIFTIAYRRSFFAMLATTMTTAWAFFFGILNPVPAIRDFCLFACLIVIFDFMFCITMFAACVAFHERFMVDHACCCCGGKPAPGTCCAPGCCWGCTRIVWRKCRKIPAEGASDQRHLELFFAGPLLRFLKRFKYHLIGFWLLLLAAAIVSACLGVKMAEKDPEGLPSDYPTQRFKAITRDYFTRPDPEKVTVIWGLSDQGAVAQWSETEGQMPTKVNFMDIAAAVSRDGQQKILQLCTAPTEQAGSLRCFDKSCLVKGASTRCEKDAVKGTSYNVDPLCQSGRYCIMEQVKEYADIKLKETGEQKYSFPLDDFHGVVSTAEFRQYMRERFDLLRTQKQHWHADNYKDDTGLVLEGTRVKYMWITFNATFEGKFLPPKKGTKIYDDWEAFVKSHVEGTKFYQVHLMYLFKVLQDILVREAFKSIVFSLAVAFVTLALVTWNWVVALLGLFNICTIIGYFLGLWPVLRWELDIYNVIFCIMAVGLSVDYTVHILHAYNECSESSRELRVEAALSSMGITVLSGAITTLAAAVPLLFTVPTFFNRFGNFIFITIFFSILTSVLLLAPLLLVLGPTGSFGEIRPLYWLSAKVRRWLGCRRDFLETE